MIKKLVLYLMLACPLLGVQAVDSVLTLEQAREVLRTTPPNRYYMFADSVVKSPENLKRKKTFNDQMAAILRLGADPKSADPMDVELLIPYLGYATTGDGFFVTPLHPMGLDKAKRTFPVFTIILAIPSAKTALLNYCLNSKNLRQYRLGAFLVLRYADPEGFKKNISIVNNSSPTAAKT